MGAEKGVETQLYPNGGHSAPRPSPCLRCGFQGSEHSHQSTSRHTAASQAPPVWCCKGSGWRAPQSSLFCSAGVPRTHITQCPVCPQPRLPGQDSRAETLPTTHGIEHTLQKSPQEPRPAKPGREEMISPVSAPPWQPLTL